jgi:hypothetical protein
VTAMTEALKTLEDKGEEVFLKLLDKRVKVQ